MNKKTAAVIFPIFVVILASLFASKSPDTLETMAINYGFEGKAKEVISLFRDYSFPFIDNQFVSTFLAGITGLVFLFVLYRIMNRIVRCFGK
ncbi:hypothetical protein AGMMS49593_00330 [Endomicrobiia bacterium]|nr:hypothetical protein AGMMS49593_00330 [Endomicrobiia bacterium]GHT45725.1 hypothetical protein AGMMS49936_03440 [Endomicrobiia bacterium]